MIKIKDGGKKRRRKSEARRYMKPGMRESEERRKMMR